MSEPDYAAEMKLPGISTCDDCVHASRCFAFGFSRPGNSLCDFWPSRFMVAIRRDKAEADDDFAKSLDVAYAAIRERMANGGKGWEPKA